ncbi:DUF58 domain-containing protein [Thalassotalea sp. LPB0316]|uniref:DUF58 domain-containing protein n=1 Tax=Thalassotalea sp. LPB0316 TaxID=2769490 RepID=UPI001866A966|nr:DUF58 domain-containing protein [Thalassotalea sp. LPB0316]QOL24442.1 DUF58 domain-containing protein [Thalassotalea sp. LPB0316]
MWFNKKASAGNIQSVEQQLKAANTNGIALSIDELIAYQAKSALINLAPRQQLHGKMSGNYLARSKGRGMEFDEVRHYQTGDDIRTIDWRVTARTGETHTKLFREEVERPVLIATDFSQSMHFGSQLLFKSVQAGHLAALLAWHAKSRGDRIGGIVFNEAQHIELKPRSRQQGVLHYLHALCEIQQPLSSPHLENHFQDNCRRLRQLAKPGALVYLITDGHQLNQDNINDLMMISRHCELVICLISDPLELELPQTNNKQAVTLSDGENQQQMVLGDQASAKQYHAMASNLYQQRLALLKRSGGRVLNISAAQLLEEQIKAEVNAWTR